MSLINWEKIWKMNLLSTSANWTNPRFWDERAKGMAKNMAMSSNKTQKQLDALNLEHDYTVLDVGAGIGRLAIPMAKVVKQVTVVEPSKNMLTFLKANAKKENIQNLVCINRSFEDLIVGKDVHPHDVVISSYSLCMLDIVNVLQKMDELTSKCAYIFWNASEWMDSELQKIICGEDSIRSVDYLCIYNILYELGILANIKIWDAESRQGYNDLNEAISKFSKFNKIVPEKKDELKARLKDLLVEENGKLWLTYKWKAAMIYWTKTLAPS
jgi:ubiquinone/menaquinone biosynthesis C-methylase UbiE